MDSTGTVRSKRAAAATAEGPGIGKILIPLLIHSLTNIDPGSEMLGVPASEIKEIILNSSIKLSDQKITELLNRRGFGSVSYTHLTLPTKA